MPLGQSGMDGVECLFYRIIGALYQRQGQVPCISFLYGPSLLSPPRLCEGDEDASAKRSSSTFRLPGTASDWKSHRNVNQVSVL